MAHLLALLAIPAGVSAGVWQDVDGNGQAASRGLTADATYYRALKADEPQLRQALSAAPLEQTSSQGGELELPMPNGEMQRFEVVNSPIMSASMAADYPDIQTYRVNGIDDPSISGRLDMSSSGFHAMLSTPSGSVFIDPDGEGGYRSYYKQAYAEANPEAASDHVCQTSADHYRAGEDPLAHLPALRNLTAGARRIYKLAIVATGEYGEYFGTETGAVNSIVSTVNRVNEIYGRDLAIQLELVKVIVYTDADSDPFTNPSDPFLTFEKNQDILDFTVGLDNYDIGHLFTVGNGGIAMLSSVCTDIRAQGLTGHSSPDSGDPFDIDFVAHEIGHQLSATHTFNGLTDACSASTRWALTATEPGSGTTIMAYAGICGAENLQTNSDATFHAVSIDQINTFAFSGTGSTCGTLVGVSNSLPSTISAGNDFTIPAQTPFVLTGSASADPNGDSLSYQWDQIDVNGTGTSSGTLGTDLGDNPLFRSFVPKSTPKRYFPRLSSLIAGTVDLGETLPTTSRTLDFRMTVRDGRSGVGDDDVRLTVNSALGPFQITGGVLNTGGTLTGGTNQDLTWSLGGTGASCPTVTISMLSLSNDTSTFCDMDDDAGLLLASGVANTGNALVTLPTAQITRARVMISCDNNLFFDVSANDITLVSAGLPIANDCQTMDGGALEHGVAFIDPDLDDGGISTGGDGGSGSLFILPFILGLGALLRRRLGLLV